jgi:hypothetical protein
MKSKWGFLMILSTLATSALASPMQASLTAEGGTHIVINSDRTSTYDSTQGIGSELANNIEIVLTTTPAGSQAVLINNCRNIDGSEYTQTFKCDFQAARDMSSCSIGNLLLSKNTESMGDTTRCDQQIAIVMKDNTWLVDPVSGNHNFNFSLR